MIRSIVDISHHNDVDFTRAAAAGMVAVIHKATEGATYRDLKYRQRRNTAKATGLLWGSYHYVSSRKVSDQIDNFLGHADPRPDEVVAIDYEDSTSGANMSLEQLHEFVTSLRGILGRYPVVYGGHLLREVLGNRPDSILAKCPLWYSRYASGPHGIPRKVWRNYTLWQYTDGYKGPEPRNVDGIGPCDRSQFRGTEAQLRRQWPF